MSGHAAAGLKGEYTVQSPAELKVDHGFYLASVAESSTLHGAFGCGDARSAFGILHSHISQQMRRRHTRPRREHPILAVNNVATCTVIVKCTLQCAHITSVPLHQLNTGITARKYQCQISTVQSFVVHILEHQSDFACAKHTNGPCCGMYGWTAFIGIKSEIHMLITPIRCINNKCLLIRYMY